MKTKVSLSVWADFKAPGLCVGMRITRRIALYADDAEAVAPEPADAPEPTVAAGMGAGVGGAQGSRRSKRRRKRRVLADE